MPARAGGGEFARSAIIAANVLEAGVGADGLALLAHQLQAVVVRRIVAGGDHDAAVELQWKVAKYTPSVPHRPMSTTSTPASVSPRISASRNCSLVRRMSRPTATFRLHEAAKARPIW